MLLIIIFIRREGEEEEEKKMIKNYDDNHDEALSVVCVCVKMVQNVDNDNNKLKNSLLINFHFLI